MSPFFAWSFFNIYPGGYSSRSSETINYIGSTGFQVVTIFLEGSLSGSWRPVVPPLFRVKHLDLQLRISWRNFLQVVFSQRKLFVSTSRRKTLYDKLKEIKNAEDACTKDYHPGGWGNKPPTLGIKFHPIFPTRKIMKHQGVWKWGCSG